VTSIAIVVNSCASSMDVFVLMKLSLCILSAGAYRGGLVAPTYGDREVLRLPEGGGGAVFIAHRGVQCFLETLAGLGGGPLQPLMRLLMRASQGADAQQVSRVE
jgi:hypothetical protein